MKARVIQIESGSQFTDGRKRVRLKFESGGAPFDDKAVFTERDLGIAALRLDDIVEVEFTLPGKARPSGLPGSEIRLEGRH